LGYGKLSAFYYAINLVRQLFQYLYSVPNWDAPFPRWLGKGFSISKSDSQLTEEILEVEETEEQIETENVETKRTYSSPLAHWRRGHWRVLESGEGKRWKNGKRIWIRPIYVNS
jgi:hypothetical protein